MQQPANATVGLHRHALHSTVARQLPGRRERHANSFRQRLIAAEPENNKFGHFAANSRATTW